LPPSAVFAALIILLNGSGKKVVPIPMNFAINQASAHERFGSPF
jgi:hypothetical protein